MGARHSGREAALQMLFQIDVSGVSAEQAIALFWHCFEANPDARPYANEAVRGVRGTLSEIDAALVQTSQHWRLERMPFVDRNLLRLGTWELLHRPDIPCAVILDEAVELAKQYSTEESSAFVNGVLNRIAETLGRKESTSERLPSPSI